MLNKLIIVVVALASLTAGLYFSGALEPEIPVQARVFTPARAVQPFNLVNQDDQTIDNQVFADKWTFIFLGYTHCPDVCPTTLAKLANSYPRLQQTADNAQVMFVSVDPKRDNSARLKEYSAYFNPEFIAASADHPALFPFVRSLGLLYSMTEDTNQPKYDVSHSGSIVLVNPKGQLHAMFKPEETLGNIPNINMKSLEQDFISLSRKF